MTKNPPKDKIIDGALTIAQSMGWQFVTLQDIAKEADVSLADIREHFDDKNDIVTSYWRRLDQKMLSSVSEPDLSVSTKDRLFEIFMERFDLLNDDREALVSILSSFKCDPKQIVISSPNVCKSMNWILEAIGEDSNGLQGMAKVMGLTALYLKVLRDWINDDSEDLSKTMASLDGALTHYEQAGSYIGI